MLRKTAIALIVVFIAGAAGAREGRAQDRPQDKLGAQQMPLDPIEAVPAWLQRQVAGALPAEGLNVWVPGGSFRASALGHVPRFPETIEALDTTQAAPLRLTGVRNEHLSAQLAVASTEPITGLRAEISALTGENGAAIPAEAVEIRFVKYLPVVKALIGIGPEQIIGRGVSGTRAPDVVGDALVERARVDVPRLRAQPIWFTVSVPKDLPPGTYTGAVTLRADGQETPVRRTVSVDVRDYALPDPTDYAFYLSIWMNPNAVAKQHGVEAWSEAHWTLLETYMRDWASRGEKVINTIITEQPWLVEWPDGQWRPQTDAGYESMVKWSYDGRAWDFDYAIFDRYVETALRQGVGPWISAWSLLVFRGKPRLTYYDTQRGEQIVEKVELAGARWRAVWGVFLEDFEDHLREKGWLEQTFLGADERPADLMKEITTLVRSAAPAFADQIQSSGSAEAAPYASSELGLYYLDLPGQEQAPADIEALLRQRREAGKPTTFYIACCGPAHPNTFTYSPAVETQMLPWIAAKYGIDGFSRWAYNSWPPDVYAAPAFRYPQGDEYLVYPGEDGPVSSIRWELLREGIEDYELVHAARSEASDEESSEIERALTRATRNPDGRNKKLSDLTEARDMILDVLMK